MTYLFICTTIIIAVYLSSVSFVMKRVLAWKYKAIIYGTLTFCMLMSVFLTFSYYDQYWKDDSLPVHKSLPGRSAK